MIPDDPATMRFPGRLPLTGVVGDPIAHSRSPEIFRHWFAAHAIAGDYIRLRVQPSDFETVIAALPRAGFRGVNVTVPHKTAALALADRASAAARAIGAANIVTFDPEHGICAENSDAFGFAESLRAGAPDWRADRPALVLGAGGAARAILYALIEAGCPEIRLANRTADRAVALAEAFGPVVHPWPWDAREDAAAGAGLFVNTTSLGMVGQPPLAMRLDALPAEAVVSDIVYTPLETPLLAAARARGLVAIDGLGMLLHQARLPFSLWFGAEAVVDPTLRAKLTAC